MHKRRLRNYSILSEITNTFIRNEDEIQEVPRRESALSSIACIEAWDQVFFSCDDEGAPNKRELTELLDNYFRSKWNL